MKKLLFIASVGLLFSCNAPDCTNGEQDGNETGIDCGGDCPPCQNNNNSILNPNLTYGSVTDIDGNEYATIQIGTQIWMAENLRTTKYCNGDSIPNVTDGEEWFNIQELNIETGAWAYYDNDSNVDNPYGKLYNWYAFVDSRNICPCNWHVPSDEEWNILIDYLGGDTIAEYGDTIAGNKMKSAYGWLNNDNGTNTSGFSGLPGGFRDVGNNGEFSHLGGVGFWWSSTDYLPGTAWNRFLLPSDAVSRSWYSMGDGHSVRCIKD